jgi:hypothetical protein
MWRIRFSSDHLGTNFCRQRRLPSFAGGAIGYMGFDCVQWFEPSLKTEAEAVAEFMIFDSIVAFDHARQLILIISLVSGDSSNEAAQRRNAMIRKTLDEGELSLPAEIDGSSNREIVSNWTQPDFENAVVRIKELINAANVIRSYFRSVPAIYDCFTGFDLPGAAFDQPIPIHVSTPNGRPLDHWCFAGNARSVQRPQSRISSHCRYATTRPRRSR